MELTKEISGAAVEAHLVERSHLIPEIRGSNPELGKFYFLSTVFTLN